MVHTYIVLMHPSTLPHRRGGEGGTPGTRQQKQSPPPGIRQSTPGTLDFSARKSKRNQKPRKLGYDINRPPRRGPYTYHVNAPLYASPPPTLGGGDGGGDTRGPDSKNSHHHPRKLTDDPCTGAGPQISQPENLKEIRNPESTSKEF